MSTLLLYKPIIAKIIITMHAVFALSGIFVAGGGLSRSNRS